MIFIKKILFILCVLLALTACTTQATEESSTTATTASDGVNTNIIDIDSLFSDRDLAGTYDADEAITISLEGDTASCDDSSVVVDGSTITITNEGVYLLTGTLDDGQVIVEASEDDKVQIVLADATINSSTSAAIYCLEADKVFITLAEDSENYLSNGGEYVQIDDNNIDAVIFSKTDLTLNGFGTLTIEATAGHGVVSKDDLVITGGTYIINSEKHGLSGKDYIAIADGTFTITSGKDGIHSENSDDTDLGYLYIATGTFDILAQGDAISAEGALQIDNGTFNLTTGEGSASVELASSDDFDFAGFGNFSSSSDSSDDDSTSQKGIKGESAYVINNGTFNIDTVDDCLHAGGEMIITTGEFNLSSGDDAIHSDDALTIKSGTFDIPYCYEGIEGMSITIDDGTYDIVASDDGLNAAGGADSSGFGGMMGTDPFNTTTDSDVFIIINGGTFTIVAGGDGIDSNGDLTINGGTLDVTSNGNGDTALDCDGTYTHNGGDITTNDGSESTVGEMSGGGTPGQMGGMDRGNDMTPTDQGDAPDMGNMQTPQDIEDSSN